MFGGSDADYYSTAQLSGVQPMAQFQTSEVGDFLRGTNVPIRPGPPFPCYKGLEYEYVPIVPIVLKWMIRYYKFDPKMPNLAWILATGPAKRGPGGNPTTKCQGVSY